MVLADTCNGRVAKWGLVCCLFCTHFTPKLHPKYVSFTRASKLGTAKYTLHNLHRSRDKKTDGYLVVSVLERFSSACTKYSYDIADYCLWFIVDYCVGSLYCLQSIACMIGSSVRCCSLSFFSCLLLIRFLINSREEWILMGDFSAGSHHILRGIQVEWPGRRRKPTKKTMTKTRRIVDQKPK